jgi:NADH-quinone oxidoreductase subunit L
MSIPLIVLGVLSFAAGFIELPDNMGHVTLFSDFMEKTLPITGTKGLGYSTEFIFQLMAAAVTIGGVLLAYRLYYKKIFPAAEPERNALQTFFYKGWGFDLLYNKLIVAPIVFLSQIDKKDFIDGFYNGLASCTQVLNKILRTTQNGRVRWYATVLAIGAIITLTIILYP